MDFTERVKNQLADLGELLIQKNIAYGNSALQPIGCFSKLTASEAIMIRLDDKLARIRNKGLHDETEDTLQDLMGYLVLLRLAREDEQPAT